MKAAKAWAAAAILLPMIGPIRGAVAATPASADPDAAIFVANNVNVTAYPVGTDGDVAPIALTTGMANPSSIAEDASGRIYVANNGANTVTVKVANTTNEVTASLGFDATGFGPGCSAQAFRSACDGWQCGGLGCGACDETRAKLVASDVSLAAWMFVVPGTYESPCVRHCVKYVL